MITYIAFGIAFCIIIYEEYRISRLIEKIQYMEDQKEFEEYACIEKD